MLKQVEEIVRDISDTNYGSIPVYLFLEGQNKMKVLPRDCWLNETEDVINLLKLRFGDSNVVKK